MGWQQQDDNPDAKVMVNGAYNRSGEERTDFLIIDKQTGEHSHLSIGTGANDDLQQHHDYR